MAQQRGLSLSERDRRYTLLRNKLRAAGLSALLAYGGTQLGVPVHYLTQVWGNRTNMVVFPAEGEPFFLVPTSAGMTPDSLARQGCWISPDRIRLTANPAIDAAKIIRDLGLESAEIGIDSLIFWPTAEYQAFSEMCPKARLVEAHRLFGEIRGPKSDEELNLMKRAIRISEHAHYVFMTNLRPGITELEAVAPAIEVLDSYDAGDRIILIHSQPEAVYPNRPGRAIIQGDCPVTFSAEFALKTGYGAQLIRSYCWHEPEGTYKRMFEMWKELRQMIHEELRPGIEITALGQKIAKFVEGWGFECDKLGHAVGVSYGDAPYITRGPDERDYMEWTVLANEVYMIHPMVRSKGYQPPFTMTGDMYLVGSERTELMTTCLPGLPEVLP